MRTAAVALVCLLVLVAGCSALNSGSTDTPAADTGTAGATGTAATTGTATTAGGTPGTTGGGTNPSASTASEQSGSERTGGTAAATVETGSTGATTTGVESTSAAGATAGANASSAGSLPDPPTDQLGWEGGYWYNESVPVTPSDGFNASERQAVINRTMARLEEIRHLEFTESVPVSLYTRSEYQRLSGGGGGSRSPAYRAFDNAKFEALFMIGENQNSLAVQQSNRNQTVAGFYSPSNDSIVVVSPNDTPHLSVPTLAHELTHALQDQQFNLSATPPKTRDAYNARNGVIEGEANYLQHEYEKRCQSEWSCLNTTPESSAGGGNSTVPNYGVYLLQYFPYSDGPGFVDTIYQQQGWEGVNRLHRNLPNSTEQVISPGRYPNDTPTNVSIHESNSGDWKRVRPPNRPDYATLGQSALSSMFGYTVYDTYNRSSVIKPTTLLNIEDVATGAVNQSDPINYNLTDTAGWDGDKLEVYRNRDGQTGYVWKLAWDSPKDATEFVGGYKELLSEWGGKHTGNGTWTIPEDSKSPFADAFRVSRNGDTVTIVNAPTTDSLNGVHAKSGS